MLELTKKEQKALLVIIFILLTGAGVRIYSHFKADNQVIPVNKYADPVPASNPLEIPTCNAETPAPDIKEKKEIVAHICGGVKRAGVFTLPVNSRVKDFIEAAGGPSTDGVIDAVNLARIVRDGEKIVIPQRGKNNDSITEITGSDSIEQNTYGENNGKIDINTATLADFDSIPGIGPVIAQRIVDYRTAKGFFKQVEDIKEVKGIGEKTFEKIKNYIEVNSEQ